MKDSFGYLLLFCSFYFFYVSAVEELVFDEEHQGVVILKPNEVQPKALAIIIPFLGTVNFEPAPDRSGLVAYLPEPSKKITWGPFVISQGQLKLRERVLSYDIEGTFFDKKMKGELKVATAEEHPETAIEQGKPVAFTHVEFELIFIDPPQIFITEGLIVTLKTAHIILERAKAITLTAHTEVSGQKVSVSGKIEGQKVTFSLVVPHLVASQVSPLLKSIDLTIDNATITTVPQDEAFSISGTMNIQGYPTTGTLSGKGPEIALKAEVITKEPLVPFKDSLVPQLKNITFSNPTFTVQQKHNEAELVLTGTVHISDQSFQAQLSFKQDQQNNQVILAQVHMPPGSHLSSIVPQFKNTVFDDIICKNVSIIMSSDVYYDIEKAVTFKQGINFYGTATLTGSLAPVNALTKKAADSSVTIFLALATDPLESVLSAQIPTGLTFKKNIASLSHLSLEISGAPPHGSLSASIIVKPTPKDDPLVGTARVSIGVTEALLSATMAGEWSNVMGIKNFSIKDVAVQMGIDYEQFVETGLPDSFGIAGSFSLGSKAVSIAGNMSSKSEDLMLAGSLPPLSIDDVAQFAASIIKKQIPTNKIPAIGMDDAKVYVVQKPMMIGELAFAPGINIAAALHILTFVARASMTFNQGGIFAEGYCSEVKFGPVLITGDPKDPKSAAAHGPLLYIHLPVSLLLDQELYLSGIIKIDDIFAGNGKLHISRDGLFFNFETKMANVFSITIDGKAPLNNPDFDLVVDFKNDFTSFVQKLVDTELQKSQLKTDAKIQEARSNLINLDNTIKDLDKKIFEKQQQLNHAGGDDKNLKSMRDKIVQLQNKWDKFTIPERVLHTVDVGGELAALKTALGIAEVGKKTTDVAKLNTEIIGLQIARDNALLARNVADAFLKSLQKTVAGGEKVGEAVVSIGLGFIRVEGIHFEGKASAIVKGIMPSLTIDISDALGQRHVLKDVSFDVTKPQESAQLIGQKIIDFIIGKSY